MYQLIFVGFLVLKLWIVGSLLKSCIANLLTFARHRQFADLKELDFAQGLVLLLLLDKVGSHEIIVLNSCEIGQVLSVWMR